MGYCSMNYFKNSKSYKCLITGASTLRSVKYIVYSPSSLSRVVSVEFDMCKGKKMNDNEKNRREGKKRNMRKKGI